MYIDNSNIVRDIILKTVLLDFHEYKAMVAKLLATENGLGVFRHLSVRQKKQQVFIKTKSKNRFKMQH